MWRAAILVAVLAGVACNGPTEPKSAPVPTVDAETVLLVSIDTLRADRLGCYGGPANGSPEIDKLAAAGTRFDAAQTTAPLTLPAHSSLLTGRTLPAHLVFNNGSFALPAGVPTIAEQFARAGWGTGAFISSPVLAARYGLARGFQRYDDRIVRTPSSTSRAVGFEERSAGDTTRQFVSWLADQGNRPVFAWLHFYEPHRPYLPPAPYSDRFPHDPYQGEIAAADAAVGQLLEGVRTLGRAAKLTVLVVADHGESLGEHGEATHGMFLYGATIRIPMVLYSSSRQVPAKVVSEVVSIADAGPTILDLMGLQPLAGADGASLVPLLVGRSPWTRRGVLAESHIPQLEFGWSGLRAFIAPDRKWIEAPRPEFYRTDSDPGELKDLSRDPATPSKEFARWTAEAVEVAERAAPSADSTAATDTEQEAQLRALGYVSSGAGRRHQHLVEKGGIDPKDRAEFLELFDAAVLATQASHLEEALGLFARLAKIEPANPAMLFERGQAEIQAGKLDAAESTYRQLLKVQDENSSAWFRLGQLQDHRQDWGAAEASYRRAIGVEPRSMEPRKALASLLRDRKRIHDAISVLEEAQQLDPNDKAIARDIEQLWAQAKR